MLCGMPTEAERLAYLPQYLHTLVKAAALNGATFDEIGGYESCAIFMPPGRKVDNVWTLVPAGFFGCLWRLGVGGCQVSGFAGEFGCLLLAILALPSRLRREHSL